MTIDARFRIYLLVMPRFMRGIHRSNFRRRLCALETTLLYRLDIQVNVDHYVNGGTLHDVLRQALGEAA